VQLGWRPFRRKRMFLSDNDLKCLLWKLNDMLAVDPGQAGLPDVLCSALNKLKNLHQHIVNQGLPKFISKDKLFFPFAAETALYTYAFADGMNFVHRRWHQNYEAENLLTGFPRSSNAVRRSRSFRDHLDGNKTTPWRVLHTFKRDGTEWL